ncbi:MAG: DUF3488 and transglutaminase-like domain-containing protein [Phycisphaerales bacterium]|nr:DUF3488 domain-containing protein [Planctomycetota bacterium]MCH8507778.1 DUF3488 and transglutaminase-like domain-containing protein [Phycisphaerales bacterium]
MTSRDHTIQRSMRRAIGWALLGSVIAFGVAEQSPEFLLLVLAGVAAAWWVAVLPERPAPPNAINAGLVGVLGIGFLQLMRLGLTVSAFAFFIGLLLVVKLFDLRRATDWGQVLLLVTALYIAAVLTSNSMFTGVMLLLGTALVFRAILRYQIFAAVQRAQRPDPPADLALRRDLRSIQIGAGFAIVITAVAVFVFIPRNLGSEAFGNWGSIPVGQTTGFTDEVQLGGPGLISQSQTPVMDVVILDRNERNRGRSDAPPIFLRGAVLETYESGRWTRDTELRRRGSVRAQFIPEGSAIRPYRPPTREPWELELRISIRNAQPGASPLFTHWQPLELRPVNSGQFLAHDPRTGTVLRDGFAGRVEYTIRSNDPRFSPNRPENGAERSPLHSGEIPEPVIEFARTVLEGAEIAFDPDVRPVSDDIRAVRALESHLRSNFSYTLVDEPVPPGREPTVWFLNERRTGHCEYYASALALLTRAAGINARVITGYVASDYNEVTGQYVVRESNAHGWIEAEIAPGFWMTFDGTPPADFYQIHQPTPTLWRSVKNMYETIEFAWISGVVGFNTGTQRQLLGNMATDFGLRTFGGRMIERLRTGGESLILRALAVAIGVFGASMAVGLVVTRHHANLASLLRAVLARLVARARAIRTGHSDWPDHLRERVLKALAAAGVPKPAQRPLREHLRRNAADLPPLLADALDDACALLYQARYAPANPPPDSRFREAIRALRASENRERSRASA